MNPNINPHFNGDVNKEIEAEAQLQQQINKLETIVKQKLTRDALLRFGNIKVAHPEMALNLIIVLANLIQQGKIKGQINDAQLKDMLRQLSSQKKDFKIIRK